MIGEFRYLIALLLFVFGIAIVAGHGRRDGAGNDHDETDNMCGHAYYCEPACTGGINGAPNVCDSELNDVWVAGYYAFRLHDNADNGIDIVVDGVTLPSGSSSEPSLDLQGASDNGNSEDVTPTSVPTLPPAPSQILAVSETGSAEGTPQPMGYDTVASDPDAFIEMQEMYCNLDPSNPEFYNCFAYARAALCRAFRDRVAVNPYASHC